ISSSVRCFRVGGRFVSTARAADAVMRLENLTAPYKANELTSVLVPLGGDICTGEDATSGLLQRWRIMGVTVSERAGLWRLTRGSWQKLQEQAIEARRAAGTSSVHESAVGETDACDAALLADICDNMAEVLKPLPGELSEGDEA